MEKLPVIDNDKAAGYGELEPYRKFMKRIQTPAVIYDHHAEDFKKFRAPAYIAGGWFDMFKEETLETFRLVKEYTEDEHARNWTRMVIGPWGHLGLLNPDLFGKENNFDEILMGVNLMAVTEGGNRVINNVLDALTPIMNDGAKSCVETEVNTAKLNREQRRAIQ